MIPRPSPHHNKRPAGVAIDCIVLHADAGRSEEGTLGWLANPDSKVSYHYLVGRSGTVYQCVPDARRAWHAGASSFHGRANVNDFSLGVSFANSQRGEPFPAAQIAAGVQLVAALCLKHRIPVDRITTHEVVRDAARRATPPGHDLPEKKTDPGPLFPLDRFLESVRAIVSPSPEVIP